MKTITSNTGVVVEFGNISVAQILDSELKKGVKAAQLKQVVKTTYPGTKASNSKADSLFDDSDFGFEAGKTYESTRTSLLNVPSNKTVEQVQSMIDALPTATLQKYISYSIEDVLTDEQKYAVSNGQQTMDDYKAKRQVKNADGSAIIDKDGNTVIVYQQSFFIKEYKEDQDFRSQDELVEVKPSAKKLTNLDKLMAV